LLQIRPKSLLFDVVRTEVKEALAGLPANSSASKELLAKIRSSCARFVTHPPEAVPSHSPVKVPPKKAAPTEEEHVDRSPPSPHDEPTEKLRMTDAQLRALLGPDTVGHDYGSWASKTEQRKSALDERPLLIIGGKMKHTYTWEEEGRWRDIAEFQQQQAEKEHEELQRVQREKLLEERRILAAQVKELNERRAKERDDWETFGRSVIDADTDWNSTRRAAKVESQAKVKA
jgi:hypothetical protein